MGWRVNSSKMWSLGTLEPIDYEDDCCVAGEFRRWTRERLSSLRVVSVRYPTHRYSVWSDMKTGRGMDWHHDGALLGEYIVVWANIEPTLFRLAGSRYKNDPNKFETYQGAPGEVIMFHNVYFQHTAPTMTSMKLARQRWFIRSAVSGNAIVRDVPGVYQYLT